jgi:hypothetical protein
VRCERWAVAECADGWVCARGSLSYQHDTPPRAEQWKQQLNQGTDWTEAQTDIQPATPHRPDWLDTVLICALSQRIEPCIFNQCQSDAVRVCLKNPLTNTNAETLTPRGACSRLTHTGPNLPETDLNILPQSYFKSTTQRNIAQPVYFLALYDTGDGKGCNLPDQLRFE